MREIEEENAWLKQALLSRADGGGLAGEVETASAEFAATGDGGQADVPAQLGLRAFSKQVWPSKTSPDIAFSRRGTQRALP